MTRNQALQLQNDWGKHIEKNDMNDNIYLSIKGVGAKVFKKCCYHEQEGYIFIWTKEESFLVKRKDLGDFVLIENPSNTVISLKKQKKVT